jgi:hypothetical protein
MSAESSANGAIVGLQGVTVMRSGNLLLNGSELFGPPAATA